jgi:alpha-beta hydrolase superfamily lysophospholipase
MLYWMLLCKILQSNIQDLYKEAASKFKNIKFYDGFLHDLLFEPEWEEIAS